MSSPRSLHSIPSRFPSVVFEQVVFAMSREVGDLQVHGVIELAGHLDIERCQRAARMILDAEPVLGCRFVLHWWRPYWRRREDLDTLTLCTFKETTDVTKDLEAYLCTPTDPRVDPLFQVCIFRQDDTDTLCIKLNHITADGGALKQAIGLFARLYREAHDPDLMPVPNVHGRRGMAQLSERFSWRMLPARIWRGVRDVARLLLPPRNWSFPSRRGAPTQRAYVFRHIEDEAFDALRAFGRQHDATLNDVVLAGFYHSLWRRIQPPRGLPLRVQTTVDLRRYLPNKQTEALCNMSNFFNLRLRHQDCETQDLGHLVRLVRDQTRAQKQDFIGAGDILWLIPPIRYAPGFINQWLLLLGFRAALHLCPPAITNLGALAPEQANFDGLPVQRAYLTADVIYPPMFALGVSGFRRGVTFSLGFCETGIDRDVAQDFLDGLFSDLITPTD